MRQSHILTRITLFSLVTSTCWTEAEPIHSQNQFRHENLEEILTATQRKVLATPWKGLMCQSFAAKVLMVTSFTHPRDGPAPKALSILSDPWPTSFCWTRISTHWKLLEIGSFPRDWRTFSRDLGFKSGMISKIFNHSQGWTLAVNSLVMLRWDVSPGFPNESRMRFLECCFISTPQKPNVRVLSLRKTMKFTLCMHTYFVFVCVRAFQVLQ